MTYAEIRIKIDAEEAFDSIPYGAQKAFAEYVFKNMWTSQQEESIQWLLENYGNYFEELKEIKK